MQAAASHGKRPGRATVTSPGLSGDQAARAAHRRLIGRAVPIAQAFCLPVVQINWKMIMPSLAKSSGA